MEGSLSCEDPVCSPAASGLLQAHVCSKVERSLLMKTVENCSYKQCALHVRVALVSVLIKLACDKDLQLSAESIAMLGADSLIAPMSNMVSTTEEDITYIDLPLTTHALYTSWSSLCKNGCEKYQRTQGTAVRVPGRLQSLKFSGFLERQRPQEGVAAQDFTWRVPHQRFQETTVLDRAAAPLVWA